MQIASRPLPITAEPLTAEAFAPFGEVFTRPADPGRLDPRLLLENGRPGARPMVTLIRVAPKQVPLEVTMLERHPHSSQTFVPVQVARYLVIVAPKQPGGGPDLAQVRAFIVAGNQGVNYHRDTWHHGLTVLDKEGEFAVFMWNDGSDEDTEFLPLSESFVVLTS
jgi:ureidoglycolate lyase